MDHCDEYHIFMSFKLEKYTTQKVCLKEDSETI